MNAFDDIVHSIYEAGLDSEKWPGALSRIGRFFNGEGAVVLFYSGNSQVDFIHCNELNEAVRLYIDEEWWRHDVHAQRMQKLQINHDDVFNDAALVTEQEIQTLPIYTDFFRRVGFGWIMSGTMLPDLDMLVVLTVVGAKERGPFEDADLAMLKTLSRHVEQSLRISMRLSNLETSRVALLEGMNRVDAGMLALDVNDCLVLANKAGEAMFPNLFSLTEGRVSASGKTAQQRFARFLDTTRAAHMSNSFPRPLVILGEDRRKYVIWSVPVADSVRNRIGTRGVARRMLLTIRLGTADNSEVVDPSVLRDVFDLTLGEARLASLIGAGMRVSAAAAKLGVTEGTARVVLKRVFEKLGVRRQAELVLRLSDLTGIELPLNE